MVGCVVNLLNPLTKSVFRFDGEHFAFAGTEYDFDINNCFAIYEDFEGYLWFGGRNGLFRYDGQKVEKIETIADLDGKVLVQSPRTRKEDFFLVIGRTALAKKEKIFLPAH